MMRGRLGNAETDISVHLLSELKSEPENVSKSMIKILQDEIGIKRKRDYDETPYARVSKSRLITVSMWDRIYSCSNCLHYKSKPTLTPPLDVYRKSLHSS